MEEASSPEAIFALCEREGRAFHAWNAAKAASLVGRMMATTSRREQLRHEAAVARLAALCRQRLEDMEPWPLVDTARGFAQMGFFDASLFESVAAKLRFKILRGGHGNVLGGHGNVLEAKAVAAIAEAYTTRDVDVHKGRVVPGAFVVFEAIATVLPRRLSDFEQKDFTATLKSVATSAKKEDLARCLEALAADDDAFARQVADLRPHLLTDVAAVLGALSFSDKREEQGKAAKAKEKLLAAVAEATTRRIREKGKLGVKVQQMVALVTAMATTTHDAQQDLLRSLNVEERVPEMTPDELAATARAFAAARVPSSSVVFETVAARAATKVEETSPENLADIAWACATAWIAAPDFLNGLAEDALRRLSSFSSKALARTLWALARLGAPAPALFAAVDHAVLQGTRHFRDDPADLADVLWAFAKQSQQRETTTTTTTGGSPPLEAPPRAPPGIFRLAASSPFPSSFGAGKDVAKTAWAFATAHVSAPRLFEALAADVLKLKKDETFFAAPADLANFLWAYAYAGKSPAPAALVARLAAEASRRKEDFAAHDLARAAWALACLGLDDHAVFRDLGDALTTAPPASKKQSLLASSSLERVDELDDARQADLYFVLLYVFAKWPELDCALSARYDAIKAAYSHQSAGSYEVRLEVAKLLEGSWDHTVAFATDEGIELDLAQPDAKVAVDVAFDYLRDVHTGDYVPSGATRFKASLLRAYDWTLIQVPFFDLERAADDQQRKSLIIDKLNQLQRHQGRRGASATKEPGQL